MKNVLEWNWAELHPTQLTKGRKLQGRSKDVSGGAGLGSHPPFLKFPKSSLVSDCIFCLQVTLVLHA